MHLFTNRPLLVFAALSVVIHVCLFYSLGVSESPEAIPAVGDIRVSVSLPDHPGTTAPREKQVLSSREPVTSSAEKPPRPVAKVSPRQTPVPVTAPPVTTAPTAVAAATTTPSDTQQISRLRQLLHSAIDRYKYYPLSARRLRQQGTARVTFRLFVDGRIDSLNIINTSGYDSLDNAALTAVQRIQPFKPASQLLAQPEKFNVDVTFRL